MKKTLILFSLISVLFAAASCQVVTPTDEYFADKSMDTDYDFTYGLREFNEFDAQNPGGINIIDEFEFFKSYALKIYVVGGKLSFVEITTAGLPFDIYDFKLPEGKVPCIYNEELVPHALTLENGKILAYYQDGEFRFPFGLDSKEVSYEITFTATESTREK